MLVGVIMRIPNKLSDEFSIQLNNLHSNISQKYLEIVKKELQPQQVNVMLADASVTQHDTFDPKKITKFYEMLAGKMKNWSSQGIAETDRPDLKRPHVLFATLIENYSLSSYFGIQYHALPFYKLDNRIKDIQIEIMELDDKVATTKGEISRKENAVLEEELSKRDIANLGFEEMLTTMYNDQQLYNELTRKVDDIESDNPGYLDMIERKDELVTELKNMIIELNRLSLVLVDHNQLMTGEEGVAVYFDLEVIRKGEKSGTIEIVKISSTVKKTIKDRFEEVELALKEVLM